MSDAPVKEETPFVVPTAASFSEEKHEAAKLLAQGLTTKQTAEAVGKTQRCIQMWNKGEDFSLLVSHYERLFPEQRVEAQMRRKFGSLPAEAIGEHVVASLINISTADPAELQDENGNWRPLHEIPKELRIAIKRPATEKLAPELWDKMAALKELRFLLRDAMEAKQGSINPDVLAEAREVAGDDDEGDE